MLDNTKNYFEIFNMENSFSIDKNKLQKEYFNLQSKYHPDRFINNNSEEKLEAAQNSILINKAYNTLKNDLKRAEYLLVIQDIVVNSESKESIKPCPILLMEVIEDREKLSELDSFENIENLEKKINEKKENCLIELNNKFNEKNYNEAASLTIRLQFLNKISDEIRLKKLAKI